MHSYFDEYWIVEANDDITAPLRDHGIRPPDLGMGVNVTIKHFLDKATYKDSEETFHIANKRVAVCRVTVENRSQEIVTNVHGQLSVLVRNATGYTTGAIGPWAAFAYFLPEHKETFYVAVPYEGAYEDVEVDLDPIVVFRDTNGRTWHRSPTGPPVLLAEDDE